MVKSILLYDYKFHTINIAFTESKGQFRKGQI